MEPTIANIIKYLSSAPIVIKEGKQYYDIMDGDVHYICDLMGRWARNNNNMLTFKDNDLYRYSSNLLSKQEFFNWVLHNRIKKVL